MKNTISKSTLGRLPVYLNYLRTLHTDETENISATELAHALQLGEVQVRKDLHAACGGGRPKTGYRVTALIAQLELVLGRQGKTKAVLVGAGMLGHALLGHGGFEAYGIEIVAGFDIAPASGANAAKPVYPMEQLPAFCRDNGIRIGILTVPAEAAQSACDSLVESGIQGIWSFVPVRVPEGIVLQQANLALSLAHLCKRLPDAPAAENAGQEEQDE